MRERIRNRLLRRADWRFLLPDPRPARSLSFVHGELAEALALISDHVSPPDTGDEGQSDLAVAVDPDPPTIRRVWDGLRPGAWAYTEWHSPGSGGARRIRERLTAAGFEQVRCYWPWPALERCLVWLPLEAAAPLDYYFLLHRRPTRDLGMRLRLAVRYAEAKLRGVLSLQLPVCVVARRPDDGARSDLNSGRKRHDLHERVGAAARDGVYPPGTALHWLLLTRGPRTISKIVGMVFGGSEPRPRLVVKIARVPEAVSGLGREAEVLRALAGSGPGGVPDIPRVVFTEEGPGWLAVGETAVLGAPLWSVLRRNSYRDLALRAADWLADLALRTSAPAAISPWERLVEPVLAEFSESFGPILDPGLLRVTQEIVAGLGLLRPMCEQRDFSPWNVLLTPEQRLAVLDWESAEPHGLPALDLWYFLAYLGFFFDGAMKSGGFERSYRTSLDPSSFTGAIHEECLARYASRTGLDPSALRALRLFLWPLHSRSEYRHFVADEAGTPSVEALRRSLFVRLWREEVRHAIGG